MPGNVIELILSNIIANLKRKNPITLISNRNGHDLWYIAWLCVCVCVLSEHFNFKYSHIKMLTIFYRTNHKN